LITWRHLWNHHNYPKITFNGTHTHSPFTVLSVTILFTVLMSDTMHDFRYSVQICHYLDNVTNKHLVLHSSVSNNFVHCADVWYNAWLFLLSTNLSLFRQCNKQTHEQTNILPFTILSVTILFTVLMSETFYDFLSCVDTCHYLPNVTNKTNKQTNSST